MRIVETSIKRPVGVTMIILAILALGFVSFRNLTVDLFPEIDLPIAVVATSYEGASPQEVEQLVTRPIESSISTIEGVEMVQAQSQPGSSLVIMMFSTGTNIDDALLNVRERIDQIKNFLPTGANDPSVLRFDPQQMPVMMVSLSGDDPAQLHTLAENIVQPGFERQGGVGSVTVEGGVIEEVQVILDQQRLNQYGLSSQQILQAINSNNQSISGGVIARGTQELQIRIPGEYKSLEEIEDTLIQTPTNEFIRLTDVATVQFAEREKQGYAFVNGKEAIVLSILKKADANTVAVSDEILSSLDSIKNRLPDNVELNVVIDTAEFIRMSIDSVIENLLLGGLFAVLILLLFLKSIRATLVIGLSIPISVIATFTLMYFSGQTVNLLTMGGLALGIGMMVDSSIVILEHIFTYRERGYSLKEAAKEGASEMGPAVIASTTTTLVVFLPIVFTQGIAAQIFKPLALTVAFSLVASLVAAITIVPMLSSRMLGKISADGGRRYWFNRLLNRVTNVYSKILRRAIKLRKTTVFATIAILVGSIFLVSQLGFAFMPEADQGQIEISARTPTGTNLETTLEVAEKINEIIFEDEEYIDSAYVSVGSPGGMAFGATTNSASYMIQLIPSNERDVTTEDLLHKWDEQLQNIAGAEIRVNILGGTISTGDPIQIQLSGADFDVLSEISHQFTEIIADVEGVHNPRSSADRGRPEMQIVVDRDAAAEYGLTYQSVMGQISATLNGQIATQFRYEGNEFDVRVMLPKESRQNMEDIEQLKIMTPTGDQISLSTIADLELVEGPVALTRQNQQRLVTVSSGIVGRDLGSVVADIEAKLDSVNLPEGYSYSIGGEFEEMVEAFADLALALIFAIFLVYAVMAVQFENFLHPFIIMFSMPTMIVGVILGLYVTGLPFSIPAFIGLIMLAGIVVNNGIILVDYINILRRKGAKRYEAIIEAGKTRLRPILMTTLTTILGMIPLSLALGEGAEAQQPLAVVIIFGLLTSMLFTLFFVPVVYTLFDDLSQKLRRRKKA